MEHSGARRSPSNCGRTSIRPCGSTCFSSRWRCGAFVLLAFRLRLMRAEREFQAVLGERNRIAREVHDTLARDTSASPCSWKCSPNCCATTRPMPPHAPGHHARICARRPCRSAPVDLGVALAGLRRKHAAGENAPHDRACQRTRNRSEVQHLSAPIGRCLRAWSAKFCAWHRKPSIM